MYFASFLSSLDVLIKLESEQKYYMLCANSRYLPVIWSAPSALKREWLHFRKLWLLILKSTGCALCTFENQCTATGIWRWNGCLVYESRCETKEKRLSCSHCSWVWLQTLFSRNLVFAQLETKNSRTKSTNMKVFFFLHVQKEKEEWQASLG